MASFDSELFVNIISVQVKDLNVKHW